MILLYIILEQVALGVVIGLFFGIYWKATGRHHRALQWVSRHCGGTIHEGGPV